MTINQDKIDHLKKAMETLKELGIAEHLQDTALQHLLDNNKPTLENRNLSKTFSDMSSPTVITKDTKQNLRNFIEPLNMKGAVAEIPTLLYWAKETEGREEIDEKGIVELYRRGSLRPPKDISQSFRDLSSKKYLRLESVEGKRGFFRLSRTGEDFVLYDVLKQN
jgi:hypothetical protein